MSVILPQGWSLNLLTAICRAFLTKSIHKSSSVAYGNILRSIYAADFLLEILATKSADVVTSWSASPLRSYIFPQQISICELTGTYTQSTSIPLYSISSRFKYREGAIFCGLLSRFIKFCFISATFAGFTPITSPTFLLPRFTSFMPSNIYPP